MNNIEENFYMTFGIEKRCIRPKDCVRKGICRGVVACDFYTYPEITDRILLELICILNDFEGINVKGTTRKELKEELLKQCIEPFEYPIAFEEHHEIDKLYYQVQSLFKGGE